MSRFGICVLAGVLLASCGGNPGNATQGSPAASAATPTARAATRTTIPTADAYTGLAVDGNGTVWFAEANTGRLGSYQAGHPIKEVALQPAAQPRTLRSSVDGSIWFAEPGLGRLGRIGKDGALTEKQVAAAGTFYPNWGVAVGPDGSVWYDVASPPAPGVARLRPDGTVTPYPVESGGSITVDSHGNGWVPHPGIDVVRISDTGVATTFTFPNSIQQMAEAADGHVWFLSVGCIDTQQIGWLDVATGRPTFFDTPNADNPGFPNSLVRAPDGAVWFGLSDGRLVRLASETDVTVYGLPWADVSIGPFAVLNGGRIVMLGRNEVLDFIPMGGNRVAGAQAIPPPLPHVAKDAAEAAAYAVAAQSGPNVKIVLGQSWEGDRAAIFGYDMNPNRCGFVLLVYVVEDGGTWRKYDTFGTQNLAPPSPGVTETLQFHAGCLNVHESPSLASRVVGCVGSGVQVTIDGLPAFADGYLWLHIVSRGWAVQPYLYCADHMPEDRTKAC